MRESDFIMSTTNTGATSMAAMITVRMPDDLHQHLKRKAIESRMSLNEYCIQTLIKTSAYVPVKPPETKDQSHEQ